MNEPEPVHEPLQDLIDDYLGGLLDETRTRELEERLCADAAARRHFARYSRLHTDLHLEVRARQASEQALDLISRQEKETSRQADQERGTRGILISSLRRPLSLKALTAAACLLFALGAGGGLVMGRLGQDAHGREPVLVPRTLRLTFDRSVADSIRDANGLGTGLTHRLPGTGGRLPEHDPNLQLDLAQAQLRLTTTRSDIRNQVRLGQGEYLGVWLSKLGFTGPQDFAVTATIPNIPALEDFGQFGLYAGTKSDRNIRGGLIKWGGKGPGENTQFLVNNEVGRDTDLYRVGLLSPGTDLRLTLRRTGGKYALTVENLTDGGTSTLTIRHHEFLGDESDLFVGLFGANPYSDVRKTLVVKEFQVTVWTVAPGGSPAEHVR